jgi:hypothetical protein
VYISNGNAATVTINMAKITDAKAQAKCWWFNPQSGSTSLIRAYAARGARKFIPPDSNDWVLVIDSQQANLKPPARRDL